MDSNSGVGIRGGNEKKINKKFLIVKLPANVKNWKRAVEMLGGKDCILSKFNKDEDLELNLFNKKIPLEKCLNNDFIISRKRMRNKNKPGEYRYKFEVQGRVDSCYDYFALHDFICYKCSEEVTNLANLEKFVITPDDIEEIIEPDDDTEVKKVKKIVQSKIDSEGMGNLNDEYTLLQPENFSLLRNNYVHVLKQLKNGVKFMPE